MKYFEKTVKSEKIFEGRILKLELQTVELCNGKEASREIIRHRGGVAVLPVTADREVVLVHQFRKPYDEELIEIPAGKLEGNEKPELCALRELKEETGYSTDKLTFLHVMYPSPGYTDEKIYIYKAESLIEGDLCLDEDEFLNTEKYPIQQALEMVRKGRITDAKTVIAILLYANEINS